MLPGTSSNESLCGSTFLKNSSTVSGDSLYRAVGAASPKPIPPSSPFNSTTTVVQTRVPSVRAMAHVCASFKSSRWKFNFTAQTKAETGKRSNRVCARAKEKIRIGAAMSPTIRRTTSQFLCNKFGALQSQRDCVLQPRVARNELPWVEGRKLSNPERVPATALNTHRRDGRREGEPPSRKLASI